MFQSTALRRFFGIAFTWWQRVVAGPERFRGAGAGRNPEDTIQSFPRANLHFGSKRGISRRSRKGRHSNRDRDFTIRFFRRTRCRPNRRAAGTGRHPHDWNPTATWRGSPGHLHRAIGSAAEYLKYESDSEWERRGRSGRLRSGNSGGEHSGLDRSIGKTHRIALQLYQHCGATADEWLPAAYQSRTTGSRLSIFRGHIPIPPGGDVPGHQRVISVLFDQRGQCGIHRIRVYG